MPKVGEQVGSLMEVRSKGNPSPTSGTPASSHPLINLESEMARKIQPRGKPMSDSGFPAFPVQALTSERVSEQSPGAWEKP